MRGNLPGSEKKDKKRNVDESELLIIREHTCPACGAVFSSGSPMMSKVIKSGTDPDLRPLYSNLDALKYQIVECPVCGFADIERDFQKALSVEIKAYKTFGLNIDSEASLTEEVRDYDLAYRHYKSALRCLTIRKSKKGKRGFLFLLTAWLLRGWREQKEAAGENVSENDIMSLKEETKMIRYAVESLKEAQLTEDFPICGINEPTFYYLMGVLNFKLEDLNSASTYTLRALQFKELKQVYRVKAETLIDDIRKAKRLGQGGTDEK
ncbi:MAG: DUF2225 domain-containing protein [Lachnospiraceae bacterium]|nr:DUF2225 domain-containing protein [Lachnospiraceae bacterium]